MATCRTSERQVDLCAEQVLQRRVPQIGAAYDLGTALDGVRQTAKGRRGARFPTLLHHIYAVERLRAAYLAVERDAALDLAERLARGAAGLSL